MKLATFCLLPLVAVVALLAVEVSAHNKKEHCKLKNKHGHHKIHKHHAHHKVHHHMHHQHHHHSTPTHASGKKHSLTPGGSIKAGVAGQQAAALLSPYISWVNNWQATEYEAVPNGVTFVPQCYGYGKSGHELDWTRFEAFKKLNPYDFSYVMTGNELDYKGAESAGYIEPTEAAALWEQYIKPYHDAGVVTVTPSCAKQRDETWMKPFLEAVKTKPDIVNVHLFSSKVEDISKVIEHYAQYGLPMWVTEFACIDFNTNHLCSQQETNDFIYNAVKLFESDDRIKAYSYADAPNGNHCELTKDGKLTESGQSYLYAIKTFGKGGGGKMRRSRLESIEDQVEGDDEDEEEEVIVD